MKLPEFKLDPRLHNDCVVMAESDTFLLLLMNNSLVPWFILVPKTDKQELFQLDAVMQSRVLAMINRVSEFIEAEYQPDKLNVAAIGNIVQQLHIHIIGRFQSDAFWPGVVWGVGKTRLYDPETVKEIKMKLKSILEI